MGLTLASGPRIIIGIETEANQVKREARKFNTIFRKVQAKAWSRSTRDQDSWNKAWHVCMSASQNGEDTLQEDNTVKDDADYNTRSSYIAYHSLATLLCDERDEKVCEIFRRLGYKW
ncbi:MAG: hypothetical protein ACYTEW_20880 [Planctomycetota bacterium]|jgi:hypothetical protein